MSHPALSPHPVTRAALAHAGRALHLGLFAVGLVAAAFWVPDPLAALVLTAIGGTSLALAVLIRWFAARHGAARAGLADAVAAFIEHDAAPSFTTDSAGEVLLRNKAARERFGATGAETLGRTLRDHFANPSALLTRLQTRANARGAAREDVVTRRGHVRLHVHRIDDDRYLWRLEDLVERLGGRGVDGLSLPMLTVGKSGAILFMNDALRRLVGGRLKSLDRVFDDLPLRPNGVHTVHGVDGPVRARVVEVEGIGGRREIFLMPATLDEAPAPRPAPSDALDPLPVALVKMTPDGRLNMANRLARDLLGPAAVPGADVAALVEGPGRPVHDWLVDAARGRGLARPEVVRARRDEKEVFLQITLGRIAEGDDTLLVAILNDATELKTLEAKFVQSQKMQAIGQLAGGVAHDFNNLLTAISGHCDLLLLRHDQGDPDYGDLVQIHQNANRAASLVSQLLAFSRKQTLKPEVLDLRDTLADHAHLLNRLVGEKVSLSLSHDPALRPVRADKRQFEQVIMNLVVNARDAMPEGGEVRLETEALTLTEPLRRDRATVPAGDYALVRVRDAGVGIPSERLQKVFEPFFSTKKPGEGTGLGLSTAYGIVKQTGGFIFVDSTVGEGTTFTLYLPVHDAPVPEPATAAREGAAPMLERAEGVVLLVEDEAPVRAFASRALRMRGYTVLEAENAEQALETLEDSDLQVDLFVTDVVMPGMDGPSWVRKALEDRPAAKVVFVSGYAEDSLDAAQTRIPNSVFLPKPFSLGELTATVHDQIH